MEPDLSNVIETRLLRTRAPGAPAIEIGILEKRPPVLDVRLPPMLLLHGATFGARLFDLPRAGYSLMAALASEGRCVYALDIRGFGTSLGGAAMAEPPSRHPPFAGLDEAIADIGAAVDVIMSRQPPPYPPPQAGEGQGGSALDLIGFSWGAVAAARYASDHPEKIVRLALYAPLYAEVDATWLARMAGSRDSGHRPETLGAYRLVTLDGVIRRWDADLPAGDASVYREDGIAALVFETLAALDPLSSSRLPPAFRCPNGPLADIARIGEGQPLYDPAKLTMPTLLVRGDDDTTSTHSAAVRLLGEIASPHKRYTVVAPGSHFLCIERKLATGCRCRAPASAECDFEEQSHSGGLPHQLRRQLLCRAAGRPDGEILQIDATGMDRSILPDATAETECTTNKQRDGSR
jgi:pimeloyl-ACP methyl ester carboxylesterase